MHILLRVVIIEPCLGRRWVGQIALVQDFQTWALAMPSQLIDHRIATCLRQACIEYFDDQVGLFHGFRRLLAGSVHVTGEPLYGHAGGFLQVTRVAILPCAPLEPRQSSSASTFRWAATLRPSADRL